MRRLSVLHMGVGIAAVILFLYTGLYMRTHFPEVYSSNESIRYLFRANHIYLLFSALLNIALAVYITPSELAWKRKVQRPGSSLLVIGTMLLTWGFFVEPMTGSPFRPITQIGIFTAFISSICHFLGGYNR